ncbi:MAG: DsrE family protein [Flavobacteriaceae bacterium]|nr:DsrE family protein [Bacteroidia bacterium]MBT8288191.1 DsrE family protein [Bacteroidia bacterium]NNF74727.1 DsrE family protein [Flavobacteriaceae bacterium]NNK73048.1 DsrE family protein [Flavobacteriaceae bacterium]
MLRDLLLFSVGFIFAANAYGQVQRTEGQIIKDFGETFKVENPDIQTDLSANHKIIFDVSSSAENKQAMNKYIETAARFLNMHADAGLDKNQLKVAMTIHGGAWQDILTDEAYKKQFGYENPNAGLIEALTKAGVDVILCGQTAAFREVNRNDILPGVKLALSAMTALLQYQEMGYRFIKF